MALYLNVHTSWDCNDRSVMICGFRNPTTYFTEALDTIMSEVTESLTKTLNR